MSKHLFHESVFLSPLVFLTSVSLLRCYDFELVLRNFDCSLEFVFSLLLLQPFNFSPVSFACNFQDWGCVILREIDFLLKICWSIPCLHPSWIVHTYLRIVAPRNFFIEFIHEVRSATRITIERTRKCLLKIEKVLELIKWRSPDRAEELIVVSGFSLRRFRNPIRVPRIRENYHRVPKIR